MTDKKPGKFDAAIMSLKGTMAADFIQGREKEREQLAHAIRVLKAAANVEKKATIGDLNGYFTYLAYHGFNDPNPRISILMALLESLPDEEAT